MKSDKELNHRKLFGNFFEDFWDSKDYMSKSMDHIMNRNRKCLIVDVYSRFRMVATVQMQKNDTKELLTYIIAEKKY